MCPGQDYPLWIFAAASVPLGDTFAVVSGYKRSDNPVEVSYTYDWQSGGWALLADQMDHARYRHVVLPYYASE